MTKARQIQPTEAELAILRVLWSRGPSTVREVHAALGGDARSRYTTTLKQLQVMAEKRLVERDESQRSHVYAAAVEEGRTEQSLVASFIDRVLEGSVQRVVVHALESGKVSDEELAQIKRILRQWEKQK
jgi:predicted transcriptional regulator